jgi:uncharacterized protein
MTPLKRRLIYGVRLSLFAIVVFVVLIWIFGAYAGYQGVDEILHPTRNVFCCETPQDVGIAYEDIALKTADGLTIKGWYLAPDREVVIIMAHGASGNRASLASLAHRLIEQGYGVMLLDLRAHGESEGKIFTQGWLDIRAAADYLTARGIEKIAVYGFSLGANMIIQEAAESTVIDAVIADGPSPVRFSDYELPGTFSGLLYATYDLVYWWQLDARSAPQGGFALQSAREAVAKIAPRPLFLIAAGAENSGFEVNTARALYGIYRTKGGAGELWVIPDVYHGGGFGQYPDVYSARLIAFLDSALRR